MLENIGRGVGNWDREGKESNIVFIFKEVIIISNYSVGFRFCGLLMWFFENIYYFFVYYMFFLRNGDENVCYMGWCYYYW